MARRIRNANPVTLFPFLAVLMCTIGALVLLLVVISAQIRGSAVHQFVARQQQKAEEPDIDPEPPALEMPAEVEPVSELPESPAPIVSVEPVIVESEAPEAVPQPDSPVAKTPRPMPATVGQLALIDDLKSQAVELQTKYERSAKELSGLTQKQAAIKRQLTVVATQEADLQRTFQRAVAVSEQASQKLDDLKVGNLQIIELLEQSDELIKSERKRVATPKHSLVPYDGQTGTIRKPIVIECTNGTIRFESEGVELDVKRLAEYPPGINPLVAGIKSLSSYWNEKALEEGRTGVAARPYALLLVRPSGAEQFNLARVLLQPLVGDYGYEFVEESFTYEVPTTTDEAADQCRRAVKAAFVMKPRGPGVGSFGSPSGGGSSQSRGIVLPRGPIDVERLTQRPAASRGFFGSGNFRRRLTGESESGATSLSAAADAFGQPAVSPGESAVSGKPEIRNTDSGSTASSVSTSAGDPAGPAIGTRSSELGASPIQSDTTTTLQPTLRDDTPDTKAEARSAVAEFLAAARTIRDRQQHSAGTAGNEEGTGSTPSNEVDGAGSGGNRSAVETAETSRPQTGGRNVATQKRWGHSGPNSSLGLERPVTIAVGESRVLIVGAYQITLRQEWSELQSVNVCLKGLDMTASDWGTPGEQFYWVPVVTLQVEAGGESLAKQLASSLERLGVIVEYEPSFLEAGRRN
ncbi:MAG: hypothetical protein ACYTGL_13235 [Planctomycetota bacterium]|jgi:hypothetical protein